VKDLPVAMLCFRRPLETQLVLDAVSRFQPSRLYAFFDAARDGNKEEARLVADTKELFRNLNWNCEVLLVESHKNLGLSKRVVSALDYLFEREERAIILEDDCVPSSSFFEFVTETISFYESDTAVALVSGNNFGVQLGKSRYYFSKSAYIWGWATWASTWHAFRTSDFGTLDPESLKPFSKLSHHFHSKFLWILMKRMMVRAHSLDTWALYFAAWLRLSGRFACLPGLNLVENVGFGAGSTHTMVKAPDSAKRAKEMSFPLKHPSRLRFWASLETLEGFVRAIKLLFGLLTSSSLRSRLFSRRAPL
jgi:hypothetical protein